MAGESEVRALSFKCGLSEKSNEPLRDEDTSETHVRKPHTQRSDFPYIPNRASLSIMTIMLRINVIYCS